MKINVICVIDFGTTNIKVSLVDSVGTIEYLSILPVPSSKNNLIPVNLEQCFYKICRAIKDKCGTINISEKVQAITVTNQRASVILLDEKNKIISILLWQDNRCSKEIEIYGDKFGCSKYYGITGMPLSPIYSIGKMIWLRKDFKSIFDKTYKILFFHDYILNKFGASDYITDHSNAGASGLYDLEKKDWNSEILSSISLNKSLLPRIEKAGTVIGSLNKKASRLTGLPEGIPLICGGGDQQCASLGMGVLNSTTIGLGLGTAAAITASSHNPFYHKNKGFICLPHVVPNMYLIEGFSSSFSSSVNWFNQTFNKNIQNCNNKYSKTFPVPDSLFYLPFLSGIGSPDFNGEVRGAFLGLDLNTTLEQLFESVIFCLACEINRITEQLRKTIRIKNLIISGGGSQLNLFPKLLSSVLNIPAFILNNPESTILGSSILAWKGIKYYSSIPEAFKKYSSNSKIKIGKLKINARDFNEFYTQYNKWVALIKKNSKR